VPRVEASVEASAFSKAIAFNVLAHCGSFTDQRYTDEEWKLVNESRKILGSGAAGLADLRAGPGRRRTRHRGPADLRAARQPRAGARRAAGRAGAEIVDGVDADGEELAYPTPLQSAGRDEVLVGRIREDLADPHSLNLFVVGDNLLKGRR
jgi:aspartate-semialdehyde dehydrogenase